MQCACGRKLYIHSNRLKLIQIYRSLELSLSFNELICGYISYPITLCLILFTQMRFLIFESAEK